MWEECGEMKAAELLLVVLAVSWTASADWPQAAGKVRFVRYVRGGLLNWRSEMREPPTPSRLP